MDSDSKIVLRAGISAIVLGSLVSLVYLTNELYPTPFVYAFLVVLYFLCRVWNSPRNSAVNTWIYVWTIIAGLILPSISLFSGINFAAVLNDMSEAIGNYLYLVRSLVGGVLVFLVLSPHIWYLMKYSIIGTQTARAIGIFFLTIFTLPLLLPDVIPLLFDNDIFVLMLLWQIGTMSSIFLIFEYYVKTAKEKSLENKTKITS